MSLDNTLAKPPVWFWVVAVILLVWNGMGVAAYLAQVNMSQEALTALPEAQRALYENAPSWSTGAFALAVFAGLLACILLLLRKAIARLLFVLSLLGAMVQNIYWWFMTNGIEVMGQQALIMPIVVIVILLFSLWLCSTAKGNRWIA